MKSLSSVDAVDVGTNTGGIVFDVAITMEVLGDIVDEEDDDGGGGVATFVVGGGGNSDGGVVAFGVMEVTVAVVAVISDVDTCLEDANLGVLIPELEELVKVFVVADGDARPAGDLEIADFREGCSPPLQFLGIKFISFTSIFTMTFFLRRELADVILPRFCKFRGLIFLSTAAFGRGCEDDCGRGTGSSLTTPTFSAGWDGSGDNLRFFSGGEDNKSRFIEIGNKITFRFLFLSTDEDVGDEIGIGVGVGVNAEFKFSFWILIPRPS